MSKNGRDPQLKERWDDLILFLTDTFSDGEALDVEGVLYLIGLQEFGKPHQLFKKEDNVNLIHIGVCTILEPFGYYEFEKRDDEGWPHFKALKPLPNLKAGEQTILMKEAVVQYFKTNGYL